MNNGKPAKNLAIGLTFRGPHPEDKHNPYGMVRPEWAVSLACLQFPPNMTYTFLGTVGEPRDQARIKIAKQAMESNCGYLLFIDDDTALPHYAINKLMRELQTGDDNIMVCGGIYCSRSRPPEPMVYQELGTGTFWKWKQGEIFDCQGLATGAMMIKTEVFSHLPEPWFKDIGHVSEVDPEKDFIVPEDWSNVMVTDDLYFCDKVIKAGFRIRAHGGVLCFHYDPDGTRYFLPEDSYPLMADKKVKVAV